MAVHPTVAACSTVQVYVTTSPEHACPTTLDVRVMVAVGKGEIRDFSSGLASRTEEKENWLELT